MSIKERIRQLEDKVDRIERVISKKAFSSWTPEMDRPFSETPIKEYINPDPEIIGNVMRWNGKDYLEAKYVPATAHPQTLTGVSGRLWIKFNDIQITDALSRMRTDDQPIWVMVRDYEEYHECLEKLIAVGIYRNKTSYKTLDTNNLSGGCKFCRLANIDDLKKAGIR